MTLILQQLTQRIGGHLVVNRVSLEVGPGELFVLLGPHGSGKASVLRIIAGLVSDASGRVLLNGRDLTKLPAQERTLGYLPRRPALFQHLSVADNIEFGLRIRKATRVQRRRTRDALLELLELDGLGNRKPSQLIGNQPQRVALARALAYQPQALLLDNPFASLDREQRSEVHTTLRHIRQTLHIPILFATHDPEEAFALADRLGAMNAGRLIEVGTPTELYQRPHSEFTATFLGSANVLVGQFSEGHVQIGPMRRELPILSTGPRDIRRISVLFRPDDVVLEASQRDLTEPHLGYGEVDTISYFGAIERLWIRLPALPGVRRVAPAAPFGADYMLVEATRSAEQARCFPLRHGDRVWVGVRQLHAILDAHLRFLLVAGCAPAEHAVLAFGRKIAQLAQAEAAVVEYPSVTQHSPAMMFRSPERPYTSRWLGAQRQTHESASELVLHEVERCAYDIVVLATQAQDGLLDALLQVGEHHLLLVPSPQPQPEHVLICLATGEPSKQDVLVAGRLLRHLRAEATLLVVLPHEDADPAPRERAERFLAASARTLALLGVPARVIIRTGSVQSEIIAEMTVGAYDMLVLGAPLPGRSGRSTLAGVVGEVLSNACDRAVLLVRSPDATAHVSPI